MKIHHLNCGSMCPLGGYLMDGFSPTLGDSLLSCHCLLIETPSQGLVLVDTGFGIRDVEVPKQRISKFFLSLCRPRIDFHDTALSQIQNLGFSPNDVRHIVLTHLDFDHAGGIDDFPNATVHLLAAEKHAALERAGWIAKRRYSSAQFHNHELWKTYAPQRGESWYGFEAVKQLEGLPPEILMVPLRGHTLGHSGIAIRTESDWLLHAGDAYFYRDEMNPRHRHCSPGLETYQLLMDTDRNWRFKNQTRLRRLVRDYGNEVRVFCAHDYKEFSALRNLSELSTEKAA